MMMTVPTKHKAFESMVGRYLKKHQFTVACAESCTGGLLTSRLTDVPGSSAYVKGSVVSYTIEVKIKLLKVKAETIEEFGVVSKEVALEMAQGVRNLIGSDIGIGITGVAGPTGSTEKAPVGFVHIALDGPLGELCEEHHLMGNRTEIKWQAAEAAIMMICKYLEDSNQ